MRVRLLLASAVVMSALAGCADKQSHVNAAAYQAVDTFVRADIDSGPAEGCKNLTAVSDKDKVAAAFADFCKDGTELGRSLQKLAPQLDACGTPTCTAKQGDRSARALLNGMRNLLTRLNGRLDDALESGACLDALKQPESAIKQLDAALGRVPSAVKRTRAGDPSALDDLMHLDVDFGSHHDPTPCLPDGKQAFVSPEAYSAVERFKNATLPSDDYTPICAKLVSVSGKDKVAAILSDACKRALPLLRRYKTRLQSAKRCVTRCDELTVETMAARTLLEGFRPIEAAYNSRLEARLIPGGCLKALALPASQIAHVDKDLKRLRAGKRLSPIDEYEIYYRISFTAVGQYVEPCKK